MYIDLNNRNVIHSKHLHFIGTSGSIDVYTIKLLVSWQSNFSLDQERTLLAWHEVL